MTRIAPSIEVETSIHGGVLTEMFRFPPHGGTITPVPLHAHETYQLGLTLTNPGRYWYRGAYHAVPAHSLTVLHPGEAHAVQSARRKELAAEARQLYLPSTYLQTMAPEFCHVDQQLPYVRTPVIADADLTRLFLASHHTLLSDDASLARDERLLRALVALLLRYSERNTLPPLRSDYAATERVREHLHAHHAENVSLAQLADVVDMTPFRLMRTFRHVTGTSPHAYLVNIRVDRAKTLLAARLPIAQVALETGFTHQSHFGRHFKRLVGVTPGQYRART